GHGVAGYGEGAARRGRERRTGQAAADRAVAGGVEQGRAAVDVAGGGERSGRGGQRQRTAGDGGAEREVARGGHGHVRGRLGGGEGERARAGDVDAVRGDRDRARRDERVDVDEAVGGGKLRGSARDEHRQRDPAEPLGHDVAPGHDRPGR